MTSRQKDTSRTNEGLVKFMFELGQLKRVRRSGWWLINIKDPESVAEHSFRAAIIGYLLAKKEGADADKVLKMCLIQDICEARINDMHKLGQRYVDFKAAEKKAFGEQVERLPDETAAEFRELFADYQTDGSQEGTIARDADLLECAFTAQEYSTAGHPEARSWQDNIGPLLKTGNAKKLFSQIVDEDPNSWWKGLKEIRR
jgi:putative hydrolases of HD superfamily